MVRGYHAFGVHGAQLPNPDLFFANPATPESLVKNGITTCLAMISDAIMVCPDSTVMSSILTLS